MTHESKKRLLRRTVIFAVMLAFWMLLICGPHAHAKPPTKSKFYDFNEQLIDGKIRKPTALYTDARQQAKFDRLLRLKKSFLPQLFKTAKEKVFK